jgi:uncharacterized protein YeaO (DUF488 family)
MGMDFFMFLNIYHLMIKIKRIYESLIPSPDDGIRILIDRLWPRGLKKEEVIVDEWLKDLSPSNELRKWFGHDPARWPEFKKRYIHELEEKEEAVGRLKKDSKQGTVTFLYSARDTEHNNAVVLKEFLS